MQMYKVAFNSQRGKLVETGSFLVCASNAESAEAMVSGAINLPPTVTRFEVSRVKPSMYELSRNEFTVKDGADAGPSDDREDGAVHEIRASAKVYAYSEASAIRRFANAVHENASANKKQLPKSVNDLSVEVDRADQRVRPSRIEQQSIYKENRFFRGGAARPR